MSDRKETPVPNPPLSAEKQSIVAGLSDTEIEAIDRTILANCSNRWLKVARVVAWTEEALRNSYPGLLYIFYAHRLIPLEKQGRLESQGNLEHMRFSEVRLTPESPDAGILLIPLSEARTIVRNAASKFAHAVVASHSICESSDATLDDLLICAALPFRSAAWRAAHLLHEKTGVPKRFDRHGFILIDSEFWRDYVSKR